LRYKEGFSMYRPQQVSARSALHRPEVRYADGHSRPQLLLDATMPPNNLSSLLLRYFAKGELAGTQVYDLAAAAFSDGWGHDDPLSRKLVDVGGGGRYRFRMAKEILGLCESYGIVSQTVHAYQFPLSTGGTVSTFLPHEVFAAHAASNDPDSLCFPPDVFASGKGLAGTLARWATHPDVEFRGDISKVTVLGLQADAVQSTSSVRAGGARNIVVVSMNIASAGDIALRSQRMPLMVVKKSRLCKCGCAGYHSWQQIFQVLSWSFRLLCRGTTPALRHDGSQWTPHDTKHRLPNGIAIRPAALLQIRGDLEFLVEAFCLRSMASQRFCWLCNAEKDEDSHFTYTNFRPDAPHRSTAISHEMYFEACAAQRREPSRLFLTPGLRLDHLCIDAMHSAHLGTFADAIGSLFHAELHNRTWYNNKDAGLEALNTMLKRFYQANEHMGFTPLGPPGVFTNLLREDRIPIFKSKGCSSQARVLVLPPAR
jgi:hypothetical protein